MFGLTAMAVLDVLAVVRAANDSGRRMQVSYRVISDTEELYAAVSDAETDQRTYLLTKEPEALAGFKLAKARVTSAKGQLAKQLKNSEGAPRLKAISRLSRSRIASLQAEIDLHEEGVDQSAQFRSGRAKMRELRRVIARLVNDEERLLELQHVAIERNQLVAAFGATLAGFGLLVAGGLGARVFFRTQAELSKRTDEARTADLKFEAMFDQAAVGMALISTDGRWIRLNDRFCAIAGYSQDQLVGRDVQKITHPDDVAADAIHLNDLLTGKTAQCYAEKRFVRPSGEVVWANASAAVVRLADGTPNYIVKIIEDITDWKIAQSLLITGEAQYRAIFDSALAAIAVIDERGMIQSLNPAAIRIFGYEPKEIVGSNISMLMPEAIAAKHDSYLARYKMTGKRAIIGIGREVEGLRKDGTTFPVDLSIAEWKQDGKTYYTGIMRDITAKNNALAELAKSEERLRLAQDATGIGSFDWDLVTGEIIGNESYYRITGSDRTAKSFADVMSSIVHQDDRERISSVMQDSFAGDGATDLECRLNVADGAPCWVKCMAKTIHDANGEPVRRIGIFIDITGRKAVEEILQKSEERLRVALASGRFGTWSIDAITAQVELDSISLSILDMKPGWSPTLFEFASLVHPDHQSCFADDQKAILGDTPTVDSEYHFIARDGSIRWVQVTGARFGNEEDTGTRMTGIIQDVTEQKEAVEKLRQGEERLRLALASGNLGTWSFDSRTGILRFDQLAQSIFGVDKDHLDSLADFEALLHPDDRTDLDRENQQLLAGSDALEVEYRLLQDNGSVRWVHVSGTIDRSVESDSWQLIGVVADVTEKREAKERLRTLQDEFDHLARVNDLGEMAAAIAHEINQPLTAISNYLNAGIETARKSGEPPAPRGVEKMMERAAEQALRAGQIVRRLREFILKGTGERDIRSADQLIDGALEFATLDARVKGVKVIRKAGAGDALVSVDVVQFEQIVVNLVRNAIESLSTNAPGVERKLTVETKIGKSGKTVEFKVTDTGPGIDPVVFPKLFEPFTTSKANGMGMGLSITKRLIEAHGGVITIKTPVCGGATFHFSLPAAVAMA